MGWGWWGHSFGTRSILRGLAGPYQYSRSRPSGLPAGLRRAQCLTMLGDRCGVRMPRGRWSLGLVRRRLLRQLAKLLWDAVAVRKYNGGIPDCGPTEFLSDSVDRSIRTPASGPGRRARVALRLIFTGGEW